MNRYCLDTCCVLIPLRASEVGTPSLPTCVANQCTTGQPDGIGVEHDCNGTQTFGTCTASCGSGYTLQENQTASTSTFTCGTDGEFAGTDPVCEPEACSPLSLGEAFDDSSCAGKVTGEQCAVQCRQGWSLQGPARTFTCEATGGFSGEPPVCQPNMCTGGMPSDSDLQVPSGCERLTTGQTCNISCAAGYEGTTSEYVCAASGFLTGDRPSCAPMTCAPPQLPPSTSHLACSDVQFGRNCSVRCADGYTAADGSPALQAWTCSLEGGEVRLQGAMPSCEPARCRFGLVQGTCVAPRPTRGRLRWKAGSYPRAVPLRRA